MTNATSRRKRIIENQYFIVSPCNVSSTVCSTTNKCNNKRNCYNKPPHLFYDKLHGDYIIRSQFASEYGFEDSYYIIKTAFSHRGWGVEKQMLDSWYL